MVNLMELGLVGLAKATGNDHVAKLTGSTIGNDPFKIKFDLGCTGT